MKLFYNVIHPTASMFTAKMTLGSPEASATPWIFFKRKILNLLSLLLNSLLNEKKNSDIK